MGDLPNVCVRNHCMENKLFTIGEFRRGIRGREYGVERAAIREISGGITPALFHPIAGSDYSVPSIIQDRRGWPIRNFSWGNVYQALGNNGWALPVVHNVIQGKHRFPVFRVPMQLGVNFNKYPWPISPKSFFRQCFLAARDLHKGVRENSNGSSGERGNYRRNKGCMFRDPPPCAANQIHNDNPFVRFGPPGATKGPRQIGILVSVLWRVTGSRKRSLWALFFRLASGE